MQRPTHSPLYFCVETRNFVIVAARFYIPNSLQIPVEVLIVIAVVKDGLHGATAHIDALTNRGAMR